MQASSQKCLLRACGELVHCLPFVFLTTRTTQAQRKVLDEYKQVDMKPADQPEQAGCGEEHVGAQVHL